MQLYNIILKMIKFGSLQFFVISFLLILVLTHTISLPVQKRIVPVQGSSSQATTSQNSREDGVRPDELSTYENPSLGFKIKYPSNFQVAEVNSSPESKTIAFKKISFAPTSGAILSINATKWGTGIKFDELREIMLETIKTGPGVHILETETTSISDIPVYRIVQSHENSPYGRDATAIFMGAVSDRTSYILSSLSTDANALQEMIDSFEFTK